jgi:hypothetical protein
MIFLDELRIPEHCDCAWRPGAVDPLEVASKIHADCLNFITQRAVDDATWSIGLRLDLCSIPAKGFAAGLSEVYSSPGELNRRNVKP